MTATKLATGAGGAASPAGARRAGAGRRSAQPRFWVWRIEVLCLAAVMVMAVVALSSWPPPAQPSSTPPGVTRARSGLVMSDSFGHAEPVPSLADRYIFDGSAPSGSGYQAGSPLGLVVGVRPHRGWAGWFAATIHAAGADVTWHTVMSRPAGTVTTGIGETVFAVQTATTQSTGAINYVVVADVSREGRSHWMVGYAHGVVVDAATQVLWRSPASATAPTSEPVTVQTDGRHRLSVWLGDRLVYSDAHLSLAMPSPFQAYLEVQGRSVGYAATFRDFWVAQTAPLTVTGLRPGDRARLVDSGRAVASGVAGGDGRAALTLPPPEESGVATLVVDGSSGTRSYPALPYAGGDVLRVG
ncbi:MAG: hypothetical protein ACRDYY_07605 [Acidimicrobiales bacterium]